MVSSLRNRGTVFQELRYPKTGMAVQSGQDSSFVHGYMEDNWRQNKSTYVDYAETHDAVKKLEMT